MLNQKLNIACKNGNIIEIKKQLEMKADINNFNYIGITPLHIAIENENEEVVKFLIKNGADINKKAEYNYSPIAFACLNNKASIVEILLKKNANIEGQELLHIACSLGYIKIADLLICAHCDINEIDSNGVTAAFWAVQERKLDCLKLLYENGADLYLKNSENKTLLSFAVEEGDSKIVEYLLSIGCDKCINEIENNPIIIATRLNHIDILKILIENGANINIKDDAGNTAIIISIIHGNYKITKILLKNKCDINTKNIEGRTAIDLIKQHYSDIHDIIKLYKEE